MSRTEIQRLLQTLFHDPHAPPLIAIEAFTVTAAALCTWCDPVDVDAALELSTVPVPRCLHDRPWNGCVACGTKKIPGTSECQGAAPN